MINKVKNFFKKNGEKSLEELMEELSVLATRKIQGHKIVTAAPYEGEGIAVIFDNGVYLAVSSESEEEKTNASYELFFLEGKKPEDDAVDCVLTVGDVLETKSNPDGVFVVLGFMDADERIIGGVSYKPKTDSLPLAPSTTYVNMGSVPYEDDES